MTTRPPRNFERAANICFNALNDAFERGGHCQCAAFRLSAGEGGILDPYHQLGCGIRITDGWNS